jgi:preprotein translocase subunit SecA
MDYLREGIHLRGFAQIEPIVAYKNEAYTLFQDLMQSIWSDFARMIFNVEVEITTEDGQEPQRYTPSSSSGTRAGSVSYSGPAEASEGALAMAAAAGGVEQAVEAYEDGDLSEEELPSRVEQRVLSEDEQIGRNDPCWCGSGKKYKKCHGA